MNLKRPDEVIHTIITPDGYFPGNLHFPLLIYKKVSFLIGQMPQAIQAWLKKNDWGYSWVNGIYDYHHYHSNTHETLVVISGECQVQIGGNNGKSYTVQEGDVLILPAGVAHKGLSASSDFRCIGAYPFDVGCDLYYGKSDESLVALERIKKVGLPNKDPIFGEHGLMFDYWLK